MDSRAVKLVAARVMDLELLSGDVLVTKLFMVSGCLSEAKIAYPLRGASSAFRQRTGISSAGPFAG